MERFFEQVPDRIKFHLQEVTKSSGLPYSEASLETISKAWLEKKRLFEEQTRSLHMVEVETVTMDDPRGALLLTYSGSLISIGTLHENSRWAEYASIGLRKDVPDLLKERRTALAGDISKNSPALFSGGPIKKSSPILEIAVCSEEVTTEEQEKRIREATTFLTNGFVRINRTVLTLPESGLEKYSMSSMVSHIAKQNGITNRCARAVIEHFIDAVEKGVLSGARVPIGRLGKVFLKTMPPRKARIGRNPRTGEQITIAARPRTLVPKISFSRRFKEKATIAQPDPKL
jgi:nucleoid DNA-binding protein